MKKKKEKSFTDQVISKLVEKTYEPINMLMGGSDPLRDALNKHFEDSKNKIANGEPPQNFTIQRNGKIDFAYKYELAFAYENNNPTLKLISLEVDGGKKHTEQLASLKELPSIRYMKEKATSVERKQVANARIVADNDGKGQKL